MKNQKQVKKRSWRELSLLLVGIGLVVGAAVFILKPQPKPDISLRSLLKIGVSDQNKPARQARIPAHFESVPAVESLAPTLAPEQFTGKARQAYQVAKQIPQTLAQLPCYCYCDEEHGHKSLHSCYETEHSSMCAVCVNEALLAYRLEKQERLTPSQIRDRIIAEYSRTE